MKLYILAVACLSVIGFIPSAASGQDYKTIDGHQFSVSLKADKPTIMLGETTFLSFAVKNLSETPLSFGDGGDYRNNIGRPDSYAVTVVRNDGTSVRQPKVTFSTGGLIGSQRIPINGTYVRKLFVPHWATFEEPGTYIVTVIRRLGIAEKGPAAKPSRPSITSPITTKATTTLTVVKTDNDRLGAVIRDIGTRMLNDPERDGTGGYVQLLAFIKDPRTIEYWIKAVRIYARDQDATVFHRFAQTPQVLATYDAAAAWAELRSAMKSRSEAVRLDIADAFSSSGNEQALPLLYSMQDDPYWFVRLRVVQRLEKEDNDAATEVLLKLLNDRNQEVWESAEGSLKKHKKMPEGLPLRPMSGLTCSIRQVQAVRTLQRIGVNNLGTASGGGIFLGGENCESALNAFNAELSERRTKSDMLGEAWVLYLIGDIYRDSRRYQQAHENYELALLLFRTLKNVDAEGEILSELAGISESLNKPADAVGYLGQELALVRSSSNESVRGDEGRILDRIASSHFMLGDHAKGMDFLVIRLNWEVNQKSKYGQFTALRELGRGYERIGKKGEARASYERALVFSKALNDSLMADDIKQLKADIQRLK